MEDEAVSKIVPGRVQVVSVTISFLFMEDSDPVVYKFV